MLILILTILLAKSSFYPATMTVTALDTTSDAVICVDQTGNIWSFNGCDDWTVDDQVSAIMFDNGTNIIYDDKFVSTRYTGRR